MKVRTSIRRFGVAGVALAALASVSCDEQLKELTGPSPDLVPTFTSIQREIFEKTDLAGRNACVSCHTNVGRTPAANLNLNGDAAYAALVNVPSIQRPELMRVAPGDPENSYLIHKMEGRPGIQGTQMPRNGPPFMTSGQILVVKRWIELGAPRN